MHADGLFRVERIDVAAGGVQHEFHVGLVDRLPAGNGGAVEHEAFFDEVLVHQIRHERDVLKFTFWIGEADVDVVGLFILDQF